MAWTDEEKIHHLDQMHEESRYYRRFHHTVFSVSMAGYIGLIILQASILMNATQNTTNLTYAPAVIVTIALITLTIFIVIPGLLTYMFVNWHFVQGSIRDNICTLQKKLGFPNRYLEDTKYDGFIKKTSWQKFLTGRGHKVFIILLWLIVFVNGGIFYILLRSIVS